MVSLLGWNRIRLVDKEARSRAFRRRRFKLFLNLTDKLISATGTCRILDIGGEPHYWTAVADLLGDRNVHITLLNRTTFPIEGAFIESLSGDARDLPSIADMSFDLIHSNSVIEHVGRWQDMQAMAREIRRIAPSYFVQTPYFWFPIEPHNSTAFFHWLPEPLRVSMLMRRPRWHWGQASDVDTAMMQVQSATLLDQRMFSALFPDATIYHERYLGLTKSLIAVRESR
jgi:hypothetical protein